jgi:hypothetical protein
VIVSRDAKFEIYAGNLNLTVLRTDGNFGCVYCTG